MRILLLDSQIPGHFRYLPAALAAAGHEVVFLAQDILIDPGADVRTATFGKVREARVSMHGALKRLEKAVLAGRSAFRAAVDLRAKGFVPEIIMAFTGWGPPTFLKDVFPDAKVLAYNDWYHWARDSVYEFFPDRRPSPERATALHMSNASNLLELSEADWIMVTTRWQLSQFPLVFWPKTSVIHDGIDTDFFSPAASTRKLPGLDLTSVPELITYVTRGMEPYRGFEQFLKALEKLQRRRPHCHAVIGGTDRTFYSWKPPGGDSWKDYVLSQVDLDLSRVHFTGVLTQEQLVDVLRASDAHVYLTAPYLPSWSLFEAMASGCLVIGSSTEPVWEAIDDGVNGLLVDFFDVDAIAARMEEALLRKTELAPLRTAARQRILDRYSLKRSLPRQIKLLNDVARGLAPQDVEGSAAAFAGSGRAELVPA